MNDAEKIEKLIGIVDALVRCDDMLDAICDGNDPEDLRTWEDDTLAEIMTITRKTVADYKKERESYTVGRDKIQDVEKRMADAHDLVEKFDKKGLKIGQMSSLVKLHELVKEQ